MPDSHELNKVTLRDLMRGVFKHRPTKFAKPIILVDFYSTFASFATKIDEYKKIWKYDNNA